MQAARAERSGAPIGGRPAQAGFGDQAAQPAGEIAQADLGLAQRARFEAARLQALLHPCHQFGILDVDPAVDAPVQVARGLRLEIQPSPCRGRQCPPVIRVQ